MTAGNGLSSTKRTPSRLVVAWLGVVEPALDVLPGGTGVVARRHPVDVDRSLDSPRTGPIGVARPNLERDGERKFLHDLLLHCVPIASWRLEEPIDGDVVIGDRLDAGHDVRPPVFAEEVGVATLDRQVGLDGHAVADRVIRR